MDDEQVSLHDEQQSQKKTIFLSKSPQNEERLMLFKLAKLKNQGFANQTWQQRALRIVYFVSRFLSILRQSTEKIKFKLIDRKIFSIIDDHSSEFDFYKNSGMLYVKPTILEKVAYKIISFFPSLGSFGFDKITKFFVVIQPECYFRIGWDIFLMIFIMIYMFYIPLQICFEIGTFENQIIKVMLDIIPTFTFTLEILINFNTAFYKEGLIHSTRKSISKNYLKGDFIIDLSVLVLSFLSFLYEMSFFQMIIFIRASKLGDMMKKIEEIFNLREKYAAQLDLMKLVFLILFVSHFCACAWFYVGQTELEKGMKSWLTIYGLQDETKLVKYINAYYWSTITLLTVGYGDIVPQTFSEKIFCIVTTLIAVGIFGYAINNIGSIFKDLEDKKKRLNESMAKINFYLKKMDIDQTLFLKIKRYFEHIYMRREDEDDQDGHRLLDELTPDLKSEILVAIYKKIIMNSKFVQENISQDCLIDLCNIVQNQKLHPNEILFQKNQLSQKIYFFRSGEIQIYYERQLIHNNKTHTQQVKNIKTNGYVLCEKQFLLNQGCEYSAKAVKFTHISYIDYQQFLDVLYNHPEDYQKYCMMRDNLLYNQNYKRVKTVCEICGYLHTFIECPFPFYQTNKTKLIRELNQNQDQQKQKFLRNERLKYEIHEIQNSALAYSIDTGLIDVDQMDEEYLKNLGFLKENQDLFKNQVDDQILERPKTFMTQQDFLTQKMTVRVLDCPEVSPLTDQQFKNPFTNPSEFYSTQQLTAQIKTKNTESKIQEPIIEDLGDSGSDKGIQIKDQDQSKHQLTTSQKIKQFQIQMRSQSNLSQNQLQGLIKKSLANTGTMNALKFQRQLKIKNQNEKINQTIELFGGKFKMIDESNKSPSPTKNLLKENESQRRQSEGDEFSIVGKRLDIIHPSKKKLGSSLISVDSDGEKDLKPPNQNQIYQETIPTEFYKGTKKTEQTSFDIDTQEDYNFFFPNSNIEEVLNRIAKLHKATGKSDQVLTQGLFKSSKLQTLFCYTRKSKQNL